jgi:hypothetical protein
VSRALLLVLTLVAALAVTSPARADLEFGMEDEGLMLSNQHLAPAAVSAWRALGVDVVRIHARWWEIAPHRDARRAPAGFRANDHNDPRYDWATLDNAVRLVRETGMRVMLTITGPGPTWTSSRPSKRNPRWKPSPKAYAAFSRAVAARYRDQVDRYLLWNEPNQQGWLQPQWDCDRRRRNCKPVSPHVYRGLVRAAVPQIRAADRGAEIVAGELAPIGNDPISENTPIKPLPFLKAMACVDDRYRALRDGACRGFRAARADSFGYHPHPLLLAPDRPNPDPDEAQFADIQRVFGVLDRLRAKRRLRIGRTFHLTEFGYQTKPPDPAAGIALTLQTRYLQQAAYLAWKYKRVSGLSFYQWDDEPVVNRGDGTKRYAGWQTGLRFNDGQPKPVLSTMPAPFVIDLPRERTTGLFWGQVRPDAKPEVELLIRPRGEAHFRPLTTVRTGADGIWTFRTRIASGARYRYRWTPQPSLFDPNPLPRESGIVDLGRRESSPYKASFAQ